MIRKMQASDTDVVYDIENQAFFEPWSKKSLLKELEENTFLDHFVYELDGEVVGFYIASHVLDESEIFTIAVDSAHRKLGIATELLNHHIENCFKNEIKQIWLEVSTKNEAAINLYKKFGFKVIGTRKNYYQKVGEDAYNMLKEL